MKPIGRRPWEESGDSLDHVHDLLAVVQPDVVVWDGHPLESHLKHVNYLEMIAEQSSTILLVSAFVVDGI